MSRNPNLPDGVTDADIDEAMSGEDLVEFHVVLTGKGGELDRVRVSCLEDDVDDQIQLALEGWTLSVGDTITIEEV